ncbi:MAG TPA: hypothetical protein VF174_16065 [Micromonosporaceae bacterium]
MSEQWVKFDGLEPWERDIEITEVVVQGVPMDLHNDFSLVEVTITCAPLVDLCLHFVRDVDGKVLHLVFRDVNELVFVQGSLPESQPRLSWDSAAVETFYGVEYRKREDGAAEFSVMPGLRQPTQPVICYHGWLCDSYLHVRRSE